MKDMNDQNRQKQRESPEKAQQSPRFTFEDLDAESRVIYLQRELQNLRQERNWLCAAFF